MINNFSEGERQIEIFATERDFFDKRNLKILEKDEIVDNIKNQNMPLQGTLFLRNNNGVLMEIPGNPNVFLDVTKEILEMKSDLLDMKSKIVKLSDLVNQLYYAPGGPGFIIAHSDFEMNKGNRNINSKNQ